MDSHIKILAVCLAFVLVVVIGIAFMQFNTNSEKVNDRTEQSLPLIENASREYPTTVAPRASSPFTVPPIVTEIEDAKKISARITEVDTNQLKLGQQSYAYITISNTGNVPITKERIEVTAGKDFGFLLGYQSKTYIQEFNYDIEPGSTSRLENQFNLPLYEGFISLEGLYDVTVTVYVNNWYDIGEWTGQVTLTA